MTATRKRFLKTSWKLTRCLVSLAMLVLAWPLCVAIAQPQSPLAPVTADSQTAESPAADDAHSLQTSRSEPESGVELPSLSSVRQSLRELESSQLQVREAAEAKLIAMGVGVLPHLPQPTARSSGELKVRLQRVRDKLRQAQLSHELQSSTVTLQGTMRLVEAVEQLVQQTQNSIRLDNQVAVAERAVELTALNAPFWEVLDSLMQQADLRINPFASAENELVLSPQVDDDHLPGSHFSTGPFRADMTSIRSTLPFNSAIGGQLELSFRLTWEPRLRPIYMRVPMDSVRVELSSGKTLNATNRQAAPEIPLDLGGCSAQIDLLIERPERSAVKISQLSGELSIAVPSQPHEFVFPDFGSGARQSQKFGDVTVTLEGVRRNGPHYEVRLYADFGDSKGALDSFRNWIQSNQAFLLDGSEQRIESSNSNTYAITPNAAGIAYSFELEGNVQEYRLVYESPATITMQTVQYHLRDIELP